MASSRHSRKSATCCQPCRASNSSDTQVAELAAWQRVQDAVQFNLFGGQIPVKLASPYDEAITADELESEADAD